MRTYVRRPRKAFRSFVDHTDRAMTTRTGHARADVRGADRDRRRGRRRGRAASIFVALAQRPPRARRRVGGVRAARRLELHRGRVLRVADPAAVPHGRADDPARLRVVPVHARRGGRPHRLHARADPRRAVGERVPAPRAELPDRAADRARGPRARAGRVRDLPARGHPADAVRRPRGPRLRRLPRQRPAHRSRTRASPTPGSCSGPRSTSALFIAVLAPRDRPLAPLRPVRAAPAHPGLPVLAAHLPARHDRPRRRRRRASGGPRSSPPR